MITENSEKIYPLTDSQKGIYFECINDPSSLTYNIPTRVDLPGGIDAERFINSVKTVVSKHRIFSMSVDEPDGIPSMILCDRNIEVLEKTAESFEMAYKAFLQPFDLKNGPLFRFELVHCPEGDKFLFDVHHLIFDGTSLNCFLGQIASVYSGNECPEEEISVFDLISEENMTDTEEKRAEFKELFDQRLGSIDSDSKPFPDVMTEEKNSGSSRLSIGMGKEISQKEVELFVTSKGITENSLFLGSFAYALAKSNGTAECMFTSVYKGRSDKRLNSTVGMFVRTLPMGFSFDEKETPEEFLSAVCDDYYRIKKNDVISFGELVSEYGINDKVNFVYQSQLLNGMELNGEFATMELLDNGDTVGDFDMMIFKAPDGYRVKVDYRKSLYSEEFVNGFISLFINIVNGMMTAKTLGDIVLADGEAKRKLDAVNRTESGYDSSETVVDLFRKQAQKTPNNICVVFKDRKYTYAQVDSITDTVAKHLVKKGIGKEKVVGVLIERSEYMLICSLSILKAGGAYLPLDPSYPSERLDLMIKDSRAVMLIEDTSLDERVNSDFQGEKLLTSEILTLPEIDVMLPKPQPEDLFVMLYTSGSTGTPKGVMFEHSNVLVTAVWVTKYFGINESSKVTAYASYGFDAHAFDMYPAVISGAQLHIISEDMRLDFIRLRDYFNTNGITHTVMTTQVGRQFATLKGIETLKHLSVAGEKLTPPEVPEKFNMYNLYGPTEGSIITSAFKIDKKYKDVPIGTAVDDLKAYVVDKNGRLLPTGAVGELWISGPHVTRGYLNRPEKTLEAYGINPFDTEKGYERIYRTGDIVRLLHDGNLQYVGRRDAQVKVRGFRVELTEIEEVIRRFDGVKDATVAAFDDPSGGKYIAAYVVSDEEIDKNGIADFILSEKPPYMVPAVIMQIDKIPLNQNHKVNKKALPMPKREVEEKVLPQTDTQKIIYKTVSEIIGHEDFGIDTDFYVAGLNSIGAVKLNVALAEEFDIPFRISDIKNNSSVKKLEAFILSHGENKKYEILPDYPISETQNGIFIESISAEGTTVYNIPLLIKLGEGVDTEKLADSVICAVNAHPYLKTVLFTANDGSVRAKRRDDALVDVPVISCDLLPDASELVKPFVLIGNQLFRMAIYKTGKGNYLFMDIHHIICDGTSEMILLRDIDRAYMGEKLEKETFSGFEAAVEEADLRNETVYAQSKEYWKKRLWGCETSCLPKNEPENETGGVGAVVFTTGEKDVCEEFCKKNSITANALFNGAFAFALSRFSGKESVTYSTVHNGRGNSLLSNSVTMLVKTFPVAVDISPEAKVNTYLSDIQEQLMGSIMNDGCSFAELSSEYGVNADIIFVYQGSDFALNSLCKEKAELIDLPSNAAKAPISMTVTVKDNKYEYRVEYRKELYSQDFALCFAEAVSETVNSLIVEDKVKDITMMSRRAEDVYEILNQSDISLNVQRFHETVEQHALENPDNQAVIAAGESLTFGELNERANVMAHALIRLGVKKETIVGFVLERTKEAIITELAILKAGGAFLPMIPTYPDERIDFCLSDAASPFVITSKSVKEAKPELFSEEKPYKTLICEELLKGNEKTDPGVPVDPRQLAYCIYTSGSTGKPKGVMIEHHNLSNFVSTCGESLNFYKNKNACGVALASSSFSFDMSLYEMFLPLYYGRCVCICSEDDFHNPLDMMKLIVNNNVRLMICTPSFMNNMVSISEFHPAIKNLDTILVGAEAFPSSLFESLNKINPKLQIINGYGPTETTVCCSCKELSNGEDITIGRPTGNVKYFVADKFGHTLPPYAVGELMICGEGVGRGYIGLPEKTKAVFVSYKGLPAYHSGDLVRLNGKSEVDFGGRIDNQVKLRGFRVELDEIEKVMISFEPVKQSKVLVRNNGKEDYLVGFFTASEKVDIDLLTAYMKSKLTYYMVPAVIAQIDMMPLTPNGKIDKNAFPEVKQKVKKRTERRAAKKSLEQKICEIFASVLSLDEVFADDGFFELGGTSLSASKVTMMLMSDGIEIKYGDIFDHPTPELLSEFIEERDRKTTASDSETVERDTKRFRPTLSKNCVRFADQVKREPLGNVLLTGAVGFLGIHILKELLEIETGHIWCLVRKGSHASAEIRLKTMLVYYFSSGFDRELKERITVIDADITDSTLYETLKDIPFDTVINSAACVKHFADDDILERINVKGVENLIDVCTKKNSKLIQISTVSVPGIHTPESYEQQICMHENELFVIDDMDNKYAISKYHAELRMFDAIDNGLRGKVIRVGNLMGRHSDGEFQVNMETNMFMRGIRGFAVMGKYPISHMTDPMSFSPVDCTARAVVLLSGTNDMFTAFNANNRYGFDEMKIIDACNSNGIPIYPEDDKKYYEEFRQKLGDGSINEQLNGLAAYDIKDAHAVDTDNLFTTNILYRIGFSWPLVDDSYLSRAINSIMTLDFFDVDTGEEG